VRGWKEFSSAPALRSDGIRVFSERQIAEAAAYLAALEAT
jgi:hypothetical protein